MASLTTYDPATGDLKDVRSGPTIEELKALIGDQPFVEGAFAPRFYKVDLATGEVVEK